jgi:aminodeoxyfutalosine synthase
MTHGEFEAKAAAGAPISAEEAARVLASPDLTGVGHLGEVARKHASGDVITFSRVIEVTDGVWPASAGDAGEVRLAGPVPSIDEAVGLVARARAFAGGIPLTGFSAAHLFVVSGRAENALASAAQRLREAGLDGIAECPLDAFADVSETVSVVRAIERGGLAVRRLTINRASLSERLPLMERAAAVRAISNRVQAFAPLPRHDPAGQPATGYDDVRTVAVARLVCSAIRYIQVDWPLYGPKLAQVALMYGANDVDGIAAIEPAGLGARRSPMEDIRRQIRAAAGEPVERNGRYEPVS